MKIWRVPIANLENPERFEDRARDLWQVSRPFFLSTVRLELKFKQEYKNFSFKNEKRDQASKTGTQDSVCVINIIIWQRSCVNSSTRRDLWKTFVRLRCAIYVKFSTRRTQIHCSVVDFFVYCTAVYRVRRAVTLLCFTNFSTRCAECNNGRLVVVTFQWRSDTSCVRCVRTPCQQNT